MCACVCVLYVANANADVYIMHARALALISFCFFFAVGVVMAGLAPSGACVRARLLWYDAVAVSASPQP